MQDVIRVGLATTAVLITTPDTAAKIGRILAMRFSFEDERVRVIATISEKGYQFGKYPTNSEGQEQMRTSHDRKLAVIGDNVPDFGLCPAAEWECDGTTLIITMPRHLPIVRKYATKGGYSRSSPLDPIGDKKSPSRVGGAPVELPAGKSAEELLDQLPTETVALEDIVKPDEVEIIPALPRKKVGSILEREDMDVSLKALRDAVHTINSAKDERGDELRLYLDTTTGKLIAKVEVTL